MFEELDRAIADVIPILRNVMTFKVLRFLRHLKSMQLIQPETSDDCCKSGNAEYSSFEVIQPTIHALQRWLFIILW